jgi:UDP-N-acetylglucosamine 3-dehydrogenase
VGTDKVAAVIGAGKQGRVHARGYQSLDAVRLVATADALEPAAAQLAKELGVPRSYGSFEDMVRAEKPDIVSVCTPPASHLNICRFLFEHGVKAVHCEKPMAITYGDARALHELSTDAGVQLTFNLQRRFDAVQKFAHEHIAAGTIGEVESIEGYCHNLFDWGSHICDLMLFHLNDASPSWVMGQVDVETRHYVFEALVETTSVTLVQWPSGTNGLIVAGREPFLPQASKVVTNGLVLNGSQGRIIVSDRRCEVVSFDGETGSFDWPFNNDRATWENGTSPAILASTAEAIADAVASLDKRQEPSLASCHALAGAEIIFATYESSRSRSRVHLPLRIDDNPLIEGLADGYWQPTGELRGTY